jgi:ribonuclease E
MKKMLVNALHPEEARVAIVEDGQLVELDIEIAGKEQTRGNIYKGTVVRVEPGLQAAFIDIGLKKLGFLQMGELHPDFWQWRDDVAPENRKSRPRIQEVLRRGQELIVQVEKGEREMKGAAVTSFLSLPGRYMVLMPGSDSTGVSRKVENETERKKLKEVAAQLDIPEGYGYIIRTEAAGKRKTELNKDIQFLVKLYGQIRDKARQSKAPALIYRESGVVTRTIRDYFTVDIDEILVDSEEVYQEARLFFKQTMPKHEKVVKLHQEKRPIFSKYQLEEQIDLIHEKKVPLKSGGSLVIEPTEALVSIDVNSGKSTGEKGVEDTAFRTNMEAAEEVGRQLRLRDLGGLIVIDFIDMRDRKHASEVEKTLKNALKSDKARVTVGRISQFGMLEMSRQRIRPMLEEASYLNCPHCEGRGKVKSVENMALSFLRKVHAAAAKGTVAEVMGGLPLEVAYYLLNRKKREIAGIEDDYDIQVTIKGKPSFLMNQLELDTARREKPAADNEHHPVHQPITAQTAQAAMDSDFVEEPEEAEELPMAPAEAGEAEQAPATEGAKKRKRKRKKKKGAAAPDEGTEVMEAAEAVQAPAEPTAAEKSAEAAAAPEGEQASEGGKKKRRRRRRRGKGGAAAQTVGETTTDEQQPEPVQPQAATAPEEAAALPRPKPSRTRKKKAETPAEAPAEAPAPAPEHTAAPARGRKQAGTRKPAETPVAVEAVAAPPAHEAAAEAPKRKRPRRPAKKSAPAPEATSAQPVAPPLEPAAAVKGAKARNPRGAGKPPQAAAPAEPVPVASKPAKAKAAPARKPRGKAPAQKGAGSDTASPAAPEPVKKGTMELAPPAAPKKPTRPRKKKPVTE